MPHGPKGKKRPAYVIRAAIMVTRIVTGEVEDTRAESRKDAAPDGAVDSRVARPARRTCPQKDAQKLQNAPSKAAGIRANSSGYRGLSSTRCRVPSG